VSSSRTEGQAAAAGNGAPGGGDGSAGIVDVTMPQMGVSVAEGTVVAWRVEVGDHIEADQTICEISTDKIDTEVPAPVSGVVTEIVVPVETTVAVGEVLARVATGSGAAAAPAPEAAPADSAAPAADAGSAAAEKAVSGHDDAAAALGDEGPPAPSTAPSPARTPGGNGQGDRRRYSPVVQRIAAEHDIDLAKIPGTGRGGRVRKQDVLAFIERGDAGASVIEEPPLHIESPYRPEPTPPRRPATGAPGAVPAPGQLSRMRRQIGEHMKRSLDTSAHCTTWSEADMTRIEAARQRFGLTALPFVARATIAALREHPDLNAWLDGEDYTRHQAVHLGIAVSLGENGLIVPVIHGAHELSVEGLAGRIKDVARRARQGGLTPDEVRGGTFTITNPGQYGSIMATPIINQPQVAILDLEAVTKRPVVVTDAEGNDSIAIRPMTIFGLSWDHRALDGALAAQFLAALKRHVEGWTGA
jgi:pyruvate/2-oxoglutarate dehydrogenase complex dihydrolipoamide acyltransferase (E2) component